MKRPPTLCVRLRETGSTLDIRLVPYKVALGGVCLSTLAGVAFATEGPVRGVIETIVWLTLWLTHRLKPV